MQDGGRCCACRGGFGRACRCRAGAEMNANSLLMGSALETTINGVRWPVGLFFENSVWRPV